MCRIIYITVALVISLVLIPATPAYSSSSGLNHITGVQHGVSEARSAIADRLEANEVQSAQTSAQMSTVDLVLSPALQTISAGSSFDLAVEAVCGLQTTDGVDVFLNFDPAYLALQTAVPQNALPNVLIPPAWDNETGTFVFSAGKLDAPFPSDNVTIVTLTFKARKPTTTPTSILFHTSPPRATLVDSVGNNVTGTLKGATFSIFQDPVFFSTTSPLPDAEVGAPYSQTLAAHGGLPPYTWSVLTGTLPPGLTLSPSGEISGAPLTASGPVTITFGAVDTYGTNASRDLSIQVLPPVNISSISPLPAGEVGVPYSQLLVSSGGKPPFSWTIQSGVLPAGLSLSPSGLLAGTPGGAGNSDNLTFKLTDGLGMVTSKAFSILIVPSLAITNSSPLSTGEVGVAYSYGLSVSGGASPFTWSLNSGSLPDGLAVDSAGLVSGIPTLAGGPVSITFRVKDSLGGINTKILEITILPKLLVSSSSPLPAGEVNIPYSAQLQASGGASPYIWNLVSGNLPSGLSLSTSGVISGIPLQTIASTLLSCQVTDKLGATNNRNLIMNIASAPVVSGPSSLKEGEAGIPYSDNLTVSGGIGPYLWSISSGALPGGLWLAAAGNIGGTPTQSVGPVSIGFKVIDGLGGIATQNVSITIFTPLVISTPSPLMRGEVGAPYSQLLAASGGATPYLWSVNSGVLPAGLSLSSSGEISGTATVAGEVAEIVLGATDRLGGHVNRSYSIAITPAPQITSSSNLSPGFLDNAYTQVLAVSGGTPGYTWSVTGGNLPDGLSLSPSGVIAGFPNETGHFSFEVEVTDSFVSPQSAVLTVTLDILPSSNVEISFGLQGSARPEAGWVVPVTIKFYTPGANVMSAIPLYIFNLPSSKSGSQASALVSAIIPGLYDVTLVSPHCLTNVRRAVTIDTPATQVNLGTLLEGDSNTDGVVSIQDFGNLASAYGKQSGEPGFDYQADFDRNGIVSITDFGLLAANYGKFSPVDISTP